MKISSIMTTRSSDVVTIRPDASLADAIALLAEYNIGALVVTDSNNRINGIISERDIIRMAARREDIFGLPVAEVMTEKVVTAVPQDDIMSVAHTMTERRFRHVPICDDDRLIGIVSIGDIVKAQRDKYLGEIDTLEAQILASED